MDKAIIGAYERGAIKVRKAVAGLTHEQLTAFPIPGTWSIQQIVLHLMDSELIAANRMKKIIAMDQPLLLAYDESKFAQNLHYHEQSVEDAITIMELHSLQMGRILRRLPKSAFQRKAIHSEVGAITLGEYLGKIVWHIDHHLKFINKKRKMVQKAK
jgi:hypothetical protein